MQAYAKAGKNQLPRTSGGQQRPEKRPKTCLGKPSDAERGLQTGK
jgi:hypothetical protein